MSDRTWEDIEGEIRGDYLRANGPESVRFREVQWKVWLAEVECAAAEKAWDEGEQSGYEDALGEQRGIRPNESARNPYRREEA